MKACRRGIGWRKHRNNGGISSKMAKKMANGAGAKISEETAGAIWQYRQSGSLHRRQA
jgi:hypothetical protein